MKKYLREIEVSAVILTTIGIICSVISIQHGNDSITNFGVWTCGFGLVLIFSVILYKAFHWKEYERENKQYIMIILLTIAILLFQMLTKR